MSCHVSGSCPASRAAPSGQCEGVCALSGLPWYLPLLRKCSGQTQTGTGLGLCSPSGIQSPPRKCLGVTLCFCAPPGWQRCSSTTLQSHWTRDQEVCLRANQGEWQYKWERLGLLKVHPVVVTAAHWTFWWIADSGFNVDGKNVISIHTMSFSSLREPQAGEDGGVGLVPGPIPIPWIPDIFKWAGQSAVPFHVYDFLNVILTICKYLLGTWLVCSFYML